MLYTTLNKIIELKPCENDWKQLSTYLNKNKADDESLDFKTILESVGIKNTLWYLRTQEFKYYYKFVTRVVYSVLPIYEKKYPDDKRPRLAIEAVDKFMEGEISKEELGTVMYAAYVAYDAALAAADAALAAAMAADAALAASMAADTWAIYSANEAVFVAARAASLAAWAVAYDGNEKWKEKWKEIEKIFVEECLN